MLVRPKVSGTSEGTSATSEARKAAGISWQCPTSRTLSSKSVARDQSGKLLAVAGPARRISGEDDNGSIERAFTVQEGARPRWFAGVPSVP